MITRQWEAAVDEIEGMMRQMMDSFGPQRPGGDGGGPGDEDREGEEAHEGALLMGPVKAETAPLAKVTS